MAKQVKGTVNGIEIVVDTYAEFLAAKAAIEAEAKAKVRAEKAEAEAEAEAERAEVEAKAEAKREAAAERKSLRRGMTRKEKLFDSMNTAGKELKEGAFPAVKKSTVIQNIIWIIVSLAAGMTIGNIFSAKMLSTLGADAAYVSLPESVYISVKDVVTYGKYGVLLMFACVFVSVALIASRGGFTKITAPTISAILILSASAFFIKNTLIFLGIAAFAALPISVLMIILLLIIVTVIIIRMGAKKLPKA